MKCLNCTTEAEYLVKNTSSADQVFCAKHIPGFLKLSKEFADRVQPLTLTTPKPKKKGKEKITPEVIFEKAVAQVVEETE